MQTYQEALLEGKSAPKVAAEVGDYWRRVKKSLAPIIGERGIAVAFNRAIYLASLQYPFLVIVLEDNLLTSNFESLETALSKESTDLAIAANQYFYQCFQELVSGLVGESLTLRLLASIPTPSTELELLIHEKFNRSADFSEREIHYVGK